MSNDFRARMLKVTTKVQIQLVWVESNSEFPKQLPQKKGEGLKIELALLDFGSKFAIRFTNAIEKTLEKCTKFYKKMCIVHNKCQDPSKKKLRSFQTNIST